MILDTGYWYKYTSYQYIYIYHTSIHSTYLNHVATTQNSVKQKGSHEVHLWLRAVRLRVVNICA